MKNQMLAGVCAGATLLYASFAMAATDLRHAVHSTDGNTVVNTMQNCVRSNFQGPTDECEVQVAQAEPVVRRVQIGQEERTIYFEFNKYALSAEAVQKLNSLAYKLTSDTQIREAKIVGYADRIGTQSYNEQLSRRRAENVQRYLATRGFLKGHVAETRWLGENAPATQCPDTLSREELIACLQKDRRVEVEIEYQK